MTFSFQDVNPALRIRDDGAWIDQRCLGGLRTVRRHALLSVAGHRSHEPGLGVHRADAKVVQVSEVELFVTSH